MKVGSRSLNTSGGYMTQFLPIKLVSIGVGVASEAGSGLIGWGSQVEVLEAEAEAAVVVRLRSPLLASGHKEKTFLFVYIAACCMGK